MVSENVREKRRLYQRIGEVIADHEGIKGHRSSQVAENAFWQRKNAFISALGKIENTITDFHTTVDYGNILDPIHAPLKKPDPGLDMKAYRIEMTSTVRPAVKCGYNLTVWGPRFFNGNMTELASSGGCFID